MGIGDDGPPDWYGVYRAAKIIHAKPWEMEDAPIYWIERILMADEAESYAQSYQMKQARRR